MTLAEPFELPQVAGFVEEVIVMGGGSDIVACVKAVQPLASVTVIWYAPAVNDPAVGPMNPFDQEKAYKGVPPVA